MSTAELLEMSTGERLEAMELLWDSLCHDASKPNSPAWHKDILEKRRQRIDSGEATFVSLDDVKAHFLSKMPSLR